jgi:hypothetical protein
MSTSTSGARLKLLTDTQSADALRKLRLRVPGIMERYTNFDIDA